MAKNELPCIPVFGCYCSGTSALTGVLKHLGVSVSLGSGTFVPRDPLTEDSHECHEIRRILKTHLAESDPHKPYHRHQLYTSLVEYRRQRPRNQLWAVKNPHMCLAIPVVLDGLGPCMPIAITRSIDEILASANRRNWLDPWRRSTAEYIYAQIQEHRRSNWLVLTYTHLIEDPENAIITRIIPHIYRADPHHLIDARMVYNAIASIVAHPNSGREPLAHLPPES